MSRSPTSANTNARNAPGTPGAATTADSRTTVAAGTGAIKLDRYDLKILRILSGNGRITKSRLAESINLSITPAWERVRKLEASGLILGYRAQIDWDQLFRTSQMLVEITLSRHTAQAMRAFEQRMASAPEVAFCYATGGGVDYIAMIQSPDIDHYQTFIDQLLHDELGIERYFTYIVTKAVKLPGHAPADLDRLLR